MERKGTLDRFEGDIAIIELQDKSMHEVSREQVGKDVKEGDKIVCSETNGWIVDTESNAAAKTKIKDLIQSLFEKETPRE